MVENIYRHIEEGMRAVPGGARGRARDRLHHRVDQPVAGRGVHPAAADGRHRRPAVPRVRRDRHGGDRGLGARLADADADDVLALPAATSGTRHGRLYRVDRALLRRAAVRATARARHRAAPPRRHAAGVRSPRSRSPAALFVDDPEGLLPAAGHRPDHRHHRGRAGRLLRRDGAAAAALGEIVGRIPTLRPGRHRSAPAAGNRSTPAASSSR